MMILFWTAVFVLFYVYLGYPLLLRSLAVLVGGKEVARGEIEPKVTLIISAYNEEKVIGEKMQNSLALDYPKEKLEVMVVSDCSTDRTDEIVRRFSSEGVVLNRMETRRGKTWGLNASIPKASGEILLFSDANALYRRDAVQKLVRNFHDPEVGCVTGDSQYIDTNRSSVGWQEDCYWNYERLLKIDETRRGSMVGSDGAIFAIRKNLYDPLQASDINDFVTPLQVVKKGFRCIYEPEAVCEERGTVRYDEEFRRKARIVNRSVYALRKMKGLLNPFRYGLFSFQLLSHKVLRWAMPAWLGIFLVSNIALSKEGGIYLLSLYLQGAFYLAAAAGGGLSALRMPDIRLATIPYYFCMVNIAALYGAVKGLMGQVQITWNPEREAPHPPSEGRRFPWMSFLIMTSLLAGAVAIRETAVLMVWISFSLLIYVYFGYPILIGAIASLRRRKVVQEEGNPTVTLLVTVYNEEEVILKKLENALSLDYPKERLKILVASDGSDDRTNRIAASFQSRGVNLLALPVRRGKAAAMMSAIEKIDTEVILFSDANVLYAPSSIRRLLRNFVDPSVGAVSGKVTLVNDHLFYKEPENLYCRYENFLQRCESETGTMLGADGAMYALRREMFKTLPPGVVLDDFIVAMNVVRQEKRVIFEPEAVGYEISSLNVAAEFERRMRVTAGAVQSIRAGEGFPLSGQGLVWFQYLSHKVLRWMTPIFLGCFLISTLALIREPFYRNILAAQVVFYLLALYGGITQRPRLIHAVPFYFLMINVAAAVGIYKGLLNRQEVLWEKPRRLPMEAMAEFRPLGAEFAAKTDEETERV